MAHNDAHRFQTPGFNPSGMLPNIEPPQPPNPLDQFLGSQGGSLLMNLLAQQGFSTTPQSPLGALGRGLQQTQQQTQQRGRSALEDELLRSRIGLANRTPGGAGLPSDVRSFQEFERLGNPDNPNVLTPAQQRFIAVKRAQRTENIAGRGFGAVDPVSGEFTTTVPEADIVGGLAGRAGAAEAAEQAAVTAAIPEQEGARGLAARHQDNIAKGLPAADSMAVLRRARGLLDFIDTGGFAAASLRVQQACGVEGADEAELSANLGKAVLSQLRTTFGAQFTQQEGERLIAIEAGFGKSTEGNKRLLEQALRMVQRIADRGIKSAESIEDFESADIIRQSMEFTLTPDTSKPISEMTDAELEAIVRGDNG